VTLGHDGCRCYSDAVGPELLHVTVKEAGTNPLSMPEYNNSSNVQTPTCMHLRRRVGALVGVANAIYLESRSSKNDMLAASHQW